MVSHVPGAPDVSFKPECYSDVDEAHDTAAEGETALMDALNKFGLKELSRDHENKGELGTVFDELDKTDLCPTTSFTLFRLVWCIAVCVAKPAADRPWVFARGASKKAHTIQ